MSAVIPLENKELPSTCYVFIHSTSCPVSARAAIEVAESRTDVPIYRVLVLEQRELSNWVADFTGVEHESPQLILIRDGKVRKVWNHGSIRRGEITGNTPA
jgi:bacillithiol system protein YtxJ